MAVIVAGAPAFGQGCGLARAPEGWRRNTFTVVSRSPAGDRRQVLAISLFLIPLPEGNRYLGFIFASGDPPEGGEAALRAAHDEPEFSIAPGL